MLQRKVFVGGIQKLTEERIAEYFLQFGKVEETVIPIDKANNNKKRGFAFVIFSDISSVKEVVGKDIRNKKLSIFRANFDVKSKQDHIIPDHIV